MVTIQAALQSIGLDKYNEAFQGIGVNTLDDLTTMSNDQLTTAMTVTNMLKGHTFKLRKFVEDTKLKGFNPNPTPTIAMTIPMPHSVQKSESVASSNGHAKQAPPPEVPEMINPNSLNSQIDTVTKQLNSMMSLHDQINGVLKSILDIDLSLYKKKIEEIEAVQSAIRTHLEKDLPHPEQVQNENIEVEMQG